MVKVEKVLGCATFIYKAHLSDGNYEDLCLNESPEEISLSHSTPEEDIQRKPPQDTQDPTDPEEDTRLTQLNGMDQELEALGWHFPYGVCL